MKTRWIAMATVVLLVGGAATAQMMPGRMGGPGERPDTPGPLNPRQIAAITEVLQLTGEQADAWKQMRLEGAMAAKPIVTAMAAEKDQLETLLEGASPDATAVGRLAISLHAKRAQLRELKEKGRAAFIGLLTAEQKLKLEAIETARELAHPRARRGN